MSAVEGIKSSITPVDHFLLCLCVDVCGIFRLQSTGGFSCHIRPVPGRHRSISWWHNSPPLPLASTVVSRWNTETDRVTHQQGCLVHLTHKVRFKQGSTFTFPFSVLSSGYFATLESKTYQMSSWWYLGYTARTLKRGKWKKNLGPQEPNRVSGRERHHGKICKRRSLLVSISLGVIPPFKLVTNRSTVIGQTLRGRREKSGLMKVGLPFSPAEPCGITSFFLCLELAISMNTLLTSAGHLVCILTCLFR